MLSNVGAAAARNDQRPAYGRPLLLLKAEMLLHLPHFEEADPLQVAPKLGWPEGWCGTQKLLREASQAWATGRKSSNIAGEILPCDACDAPRTVGVGE